MSKIKDENHYIIQGWMINQLNLKGVALSVFAIIYGFTQDGETEFNGSRQYLCDFTNTTKPTIDKALDELLAKNFIIKTTVKVNGVIFNKYKVNFDVLKNFIGGKETLQGGKETLQGGSKETLPNNYSIDNKEDNIEYVVGKKPPTKEEVIEYAKTKDRLDLADKFYDYYTIGNWKDRDGRKIKNWKQKFITWMNKTEKPKDGFIHNNYTAEKISSLITNLEDVDI